MHCRLESWLYPIVPDLIKRYLGELFSDKDAVFFYGGGTLTRKILDLISLEDRKKIKGIIDKNYEIVSYDIPVMNLHSFLSVAPAYDAIVISHYDWEWMLKECLLRKGVRENLIFSIFSAEKYSNMVQYNYAPIEKKGSKSRAVFITLKSGIKILDDYLLRHFPRDSWQYYRLDMSREYQSTFDLYDKEFDCQRSLINLVHYLRKILPNVIYIHDQIETFYFLLEFIKKKFKDVRIVWEPYDLVSNSHVNPEFMKEAKGLTQVQFDWVLENEIFCIKNADKIIHKELEGIIDDGQLVENSYYYSFVQEHKIGLCGIQQRIAKKPFELVYAGSLMNVTQGDKFNSPGLLYGEFEKILSSDEVIIDTYINANQDEINAFFNNYKALEKKYRNYRILSRLKKSVLLNLLAKQYHWGLVVAHCENGVLDNMLAKNSSSKKLFTYLSVGLPVIVTKEITGISGFIEENGLGVSVSWWEHRRIGSILSEITDQTYNEFQENISIYLRSNDANTMVDDFMKLLSGQSN